VEVAVDSVPVQGCLDLFDTAEALGAAPIGIPRKEAAAMTGVYLHRGHRWCVLVSAHPGGRITTACGDAISYGPVLVCTSDPGELACARCRAELAADDLDDDALGPDSEAIAGALDEHEDLLGDDDAGAFDHHHDLREVDVDKSRVTGTRRVPP
jgi:hypothetical protein